MYMILQYEINFALFRAEYENIPTYNWIQRQGRWFLIQVKEAELTKNRWK